MSGDKPTVVYWDACIFLALLKDEQREPGAMEGVKYWASRVMDRKVVLITSVITTVEILEGNNPPGVKATFDQLFNRSNITRYNVDPRIAEKAHDLRDYYDKQRTKGNGDPQLCIADALHLATALIYRADQFHTFDRFGQKGCLGLLPLDGSVAGHKLRICSPEAPPPPPVEQSTLFDAEAGGTRA